MNERMFTAFLSYSVVVVLWISGSSARLAPSYIKPCPGQKSECLKKTIQEVLPKFSKGIPELGIEPIDPLKQDKVQLTLPGGLKIELNNGSMTGLKNCRIDSATLANDNGELKMHCDLTIRGTYRANGRILIITIDGNGLAKIKIKNAFVHIKIKFADKVRDGVVYYEVKDLSSEFGYGDKVSFDLSNLFQGSPELSEAVLLFLNQNWKQISEEFGAPLVDKLINIVFTIVKKFFEAVPKNELFVD